MIEIREATREDNAGLLELTRLTPMDGLISPRIDRAPDFFRLPELCGEGKIFVAKGGENIKAKSQILIAAVFFSLFLSTGCRHPTEPQHDVNWVQVSSGMVRSLAMSGNYLFAGRNDGQVFRSPDNGTHWTAVNFSDPIAFVIVSAIVVSGRNIFAATIGGGVFLSSNYGDSWALANAGLPSDGFITSLAISGTNLFAGNEGGGVFRSTDSGVSWTAMNSGLPAYCYINAIAVSRANIFAGGYYYGGGGLYRSTNNGAGWVSIDTGLTNTFVNSLTSSGTNLFVGTWQGGVFRSTDNGSSWYAANSGLTGNSAHDVSTLAFAGTNLFAGTFGGVFISSDDGLSWTDANLGLTSKPVYSFAVSDTYIFAATDSGVWRRQR